MGLCASVEKGPDGEDMPDDPEDLIPPPGAASNGALSGPSKQQYPKMRMPVDDVGKFKGLNSSFDHAWDSVEPPVGLLLRTVSGVGEILPFSHPVSIPHHIFPHHYFLLTVATTPPLLLSSLRSPHAEPPLLLLLLSSHQSQHTPCFLSYVVLAQLF